MKYGAIKNVALKQDINVLVDTSSQAVGAYLAAVAMKASPYTFDAAMACLNDVLDVIAVRYPFRIQEKVL